MTKKNICSLSMNYKSQISNQSIIKFQVEFKPLVKSTEQNNDFVQHALLMFVASVQKENYFSRCSTKNFRNFVEGSKTPSLALNNDHY
jgi:hypothetical protein